MSDRWFTEHRAQVLSDLEQLLHDIRSTADGLGNQKVDNLIQQAEQQRAAAEAALHAFAEQRHTLATMLDTLQSELAVAGRPLRGEVS
jgi:ABC-type transporter Mla subunit MlaD